MSSPSGVALSGVARPASHTDAALPESKKAKSEWKTRLITALRNPDAATLSNCLKEIPDVSFVYRRVDKAKVTREEFATFLDHYFEVDPAHLRPVVEPAFPLSTFTLLRTMFEEINFSDPSMPNYCPEKRVAEIDSPGDKVTVERLRKNFYNLVTHLHDEKKTDDETVALRKVYARAIGHLQPLSPEDRRPYLIDLAAGSLQLKARWQREAEDLCNIFERLGDQKTLSVALKEMRQSLYVGIARGDIHGYHYLMQAMGEEDGYTDQSAFTITPEVIRMEFFKEYKPSRIYQALQPTIESKQESEHRVFNTEARVGLLVADKILKRKA